MRPRAQMRLTASVSSGRFSLTMVKSKRLVLPSWLLLPKEQCNQETTASCSSFLAALRRQHGTPRAATRLAACATALLVLHPRTHPICLVHVLAPLHTHLHLLLQPCHHLLLPCQHPRHSRSNGCKLEQHPPRRNSGCQRRLRLLVHCWHLASRDLEATGKCCVQAAEVRFSVASTLA